MSIDPVMDSGAMAGMAHEAMPSADAGREVEDKGMGDMEGMEQGVEPPAGQLRDPHGYADGYDFGSIPPPRMGDEHSFGSLRVDRLEWVHASGNVSAAYDLQAWYGRDYDRAVVKAEGDVDRNKVREGRAELLWGHAVAPFWDAQLGLRQDYGTRPGRGWLAFGVQGLAPYYFELDASGYLGEAGRSALRVDAEYELLFTQRLILQPRVEANFYGESDQALGRGAGLSALAAGVRLRYELRRELAPYIGIEWARKYGGTASYARIAGEPREEARLVMGLRFWF